MKVGPRPWAFALALVVCLGWPAGAALGEVLEIEPGQRLEKNIGAGERHVFSVAGVSDRASRVAVEQFGIDVVIDFETPDGRLELNHPLGRFDREVFDLPAEVERFEIRPLEGGVAAGHYAITLQWVTTAEDGLRQSAQARLMQAAAVPLRGSREAMEQAAELYEAAAEDWAALGDSGEEARARLSAANFRRVLGDAELAHALYRQAWELFQQLDRPGFVADCLAGLGQTARHLGQPEAAREFLEQAVEQFQALGRRPEGAGVLTILGLLAQIQGNLPHALAVYREALAEQQKVGQRLEIAILWLNLGSVHGRLGDAEGAIRDVGQALALFRELGDRHREHRALNNLAVLHRRMGEPEVALGLYGQILKLASEHGDRRAEALAFSNRGVTHFVMGDLERAAHDLERALNLRRASEDLVGQVHTLSNLGEVEYHRSDFSIARRYFETALELARRLQHRQEVALLGSLGRLLARLGDSSAKQLFAEAHELLDGRDDPAATATLHYREGEGLLYGGDGVAAEVALQRALELLRALGDEVRQAMALTALGRVAYQSGRWQAADEHLSAAIVLIESRRTEIANPNLRASFLSARHEAYELMLDVLMRRHAAEPEAGHDRAALELSERSRGRRLLELLAEAEVDFGSTVAPELMDQRRDLLRRLSLQVRRRELIALGRQLPIAGQDLDAIIHDLRTELDLVDGEIRRRDPRRATLAPPVPLTTDAMQQLLDPETVLLHFSLGQPRSFLWVVTAHKVESFVLPGRHQIEPAARRLHETWSTLGPSSIASEEEQAAALAAQILGPAADRLRGRRLVVVADGALHYLPFAALPMPDAAGRAIDASLRTPSRLVERFEILRLPSVAVLATERRRVAPAAQPPTIAVFADPIFEPSDPRLAELSAGFAATGFAATESAGKESAGEEKVIEEGKIVREGDPFREGAIVPGGELVREGGAFVGFGRLPATRLEAEAIVEHVAPERRNVSLGIDASRAALDGLADRSIVHFATHAMVDTEHPELSSLVLSLFDPAGRRTDGMLRLHDIYRLKLDADLVVLSGCRTGLGRELRGEGLQGLTGGFFYAGARRVVASLWSVADRATAELMGRFYRAHLAEELSPAAALRRAQLDLLQDRRFHDPYFWAPFVLHGDWR